ncbi:hypothetical protein [Dictyobacter arantiisoli]|uniref:Uncharacterized protein n=1 Tax=Dictyobacter arantiisoli TaxID=2014874 RepID=A0A5A5T9P8_9CHLR|nr:hypothetical protein [Dictyobacter arantiisoli]GCF08057.1 hypothetical protein KDI_16210 [Dictyobacter arantiisoli]
MAKSIREAVFVLSIALLVTSSPTLWIKPAIEHTAIQAQIQVTQGANQSQQFNKGDSRGVTCPPPPRGCW